MPILRIKEIRNLSHEDRTKRLEDMRTELMRLRTMIRAGGTVENPARVRQLRKAIAKILTIEHEEKLGIRKAKPEAKKPEPEKPEPKKTEAKETEPKKPETTTGRKKTK